MSPSNSKRRNRGRQPQQMPPLSIITRVSSSSPPLGQRSHHRSDFRSGNNSTKQQNSATPSLLVSLSESCRKHSASAHASNKGLCAATVSEAPQCCQEALRSLRTILPKVERAYPPHKSAVQDVAHMCDFYQDVLSGGFCPNAPHLFLGVPQVLPRVYFLFQHLASQAVIHNSSERSASDAAPTASHIAQTAARLLNAVPNSNILDCILSDLIYLSKDLSILYESNLLDESDNHTVEVVLFRETVESSDWTAAPTVPEFALRLNSNESLLSVHGAILTILEHFGRFRKKRRLLLLHEHTDAVSAVLEELDDAYLTSGDPDLFYGYLQTDIESFRALLLSLRHVLLTGMVAKEDVSKISPDCLSLMALSRRSALQILLQLHADWDRTGAPTKSLLQETAIAVVECAVQLLRTSSAAEEPVADDLARLVHAFVLNPPSVRSSLKRSATATAVRGSTASVIFESVHDMQCKAVNLNEKASTNVPATAKESRLLEIVLLRSLYATIIDCQNRPGGKYHQGPSPLSAQLFLKNDAVSCLFDFLRDPILADNSVLTLANLLCPVGAPQSRLFEINDIAKLCLETPGRGTGDALETLRDPLSSKATSGPKRKTGPDDHLSGPPRRSRKRRKTGGQRFVTSASSSFDDMLSSLFDEALQSIDRVNAARNNGIQSNADGIFLVCSGFKLLVAMVTNTSTGRTGSLLATACPYLSQLVNRLLAAMTVVGTSLQSRSKACSAENCEELKTIADAVVSCSIFQDILVGDDLENQVPSCLVSILEAKRWRETVETTNDSQPSCGFRSRLQGILQGTIICCAMKYSECYFTDLVMSSVTFGGAFTVSIGNAENAAGFVVPVAQLLASLNFRIVESLKHLVAWSGEDWTLTENLLGYTLDCVKPFLDKSHKDPVVRLLVWQCITWMFRSSSPQELRPLLASEDTLGHRLVYFLIDTALGDPDATVQDYASRELGKALGSDPWDCLIAAMATVDEWEKLQGDSNACLSTVRRAAEQVKSSIFQHVDKALHKLCSMPQSQLSFMVPSKQTITSPKRSVHAATSMLTFRRSAARTLCSLCGFSPPRNYLGRLMQEHAIIRVVRLWSIIDTVPRFEYTGVCFAELSRIFMLQDSDLTLKHSMLPTFAPAVFRDILVPGSTPLITGAQDTIDTMPHSFQERQFELLSTFVRASLVHCWSQTTVSVSTDDSDLERSVESCLPFVISQLIVEKDCTALHLTSAFKLYMLALKRVEHKRRKRSSTSYLETEMTTGLVVGGTVPLSSISSSSRQWSRSLEEQTRQLCLAPGLIEQIIPLVFMRAGRSELVFFTKDVLQDRLSLKQLVTSREMLTLKNFVLELGRNPEMTGSVIRAMETAAVARSQDNGFTFENCSRSAPAQPEQRGDSPLSVWLTTHFMYLLVNVVQFRWTTKTVKLRVQALRSLVAIIDFLRPSEAPQYLPQIMATVSAALAENVPDGTSDICDRSAHLQLRLLAVQVLSRFVKLIAETQWSILGQNLTSIVVSLIPVLSDDQWNHSRNEKLSKESRSTAVALLEFLTQKGDLGRYLAPSFSEIPFLPPSSALDSVRASLRAFGINFDTLQVASTQVSQLEAIARGETNDNGSVSVDSRGAAQNASRQNALRGRLETVCSLLGNENTSVRRVVLEHLTALLQANRELFHALVENEATASMKRYLTVPYPGRKGVSRGPVTEIVETLLQRCVHETDLDARVLLATCFGEVGAVGVHRLEETQPSQFGSTLDSFQRSCDPPWYSTSHGYELRLITQHLVVALKAAPTSSDQHKIAFTIQQLLALLNEAAKEGLLAGPSSVGKQHSAKRNSLSRSKVDQSNRNNDLITKPQMEQTLLDKLVEAKVLDIVEPFWFSEFHEAENNPPRQPPFFRTSSTFYGWLSNWCRYMVHRAHSTGRNEWTKLFFACRTSLRTQAGLRVADFLLPLLVLERLCFGGVAGQNTLLSEIDDVLTLCAQDKVGAASQNMSRSDRRKAVGTIFALLDLLQQWVEPETDRRYLMKRGRQNEGQPRTPKSSSESSGWEQHDAAMRIEDTVGKISYSLRARAAANVGMHGCALRYLEMASRASIADQVYGRSGAGLHRNSNRSCAAGVCPKKDVGLMKDVLASLNDYETMSVMGEDDIWASPTEKVRDSIRQKEALRDWQGALHDYERAQQLNLDDPSLRLNFVRCQIQLGHFESVLMQVDGMIRENHDAFAPTTAAIVPLAIEASWRLGKWDKLADLLETERSFIKDPDGLYQVHLGEAMLSVRQKEFDRALTSVKYARTAVMDGLSSVARESYVRAYDHVVRLQALREIEDMANLPRTQEGSALGELVDDAAVGWDRRLDFVSSSGATAIINVRLALARLSGDTSFEGSLFLRMGKRGRKNGMLSVAANSFAQAEAALDCIDNDRKAVLKSDLQMQLAKIKHECGDSSVALRMLGQENIEVMNVLDDDELIRQARCRVVDVLGIENHGMNESKITDVFVRSALQSTRWMVEGGLKGGAEITSRFRIIHRVAPKFEKGHFQYAKYVDSLLQARIIALRGHSVRHPSGADEEMHRSFVISRDKSCQRYLSLAINHYAISLQLQVKHVYQSLPRLLSLWFDFTAMNYDFLASESTGTRASDEDLSKFLSESQEEINVFVSRSVKSFPAHALYTAMPQLISRITHENLLTAQIAQAMLRRILTKHPAQAMWPLAWIRQSRDPDRKKIGIEIFNKAVQSSIKGKNEVMEKLLVSSKTLLEYLHDIAIADTEKNADRLSLKPINGVDLTDFVPPVQAALSVSLASGDSGRARDIFPRHVPRIRAFDLTVQVMISKARPKKLRAFMVSADGNTRLCARSDRSPRRSEADIGEMHFLVKQEAKGDLRKDARVQDLNNVVNRIITASNDSKGLSAQRCRLHLRTFTVTCLSEETGILEWVPHTGSMRGFITKAYNPQAKNSEGKRHGKRLVRFNDPQVKLKFEQSCQNRYFKGGNLTEAAAVFEREFLKPFPPLLYWWFVSQYPDPHAWYEARTRFALSAAAWSAVGHVIGLGDRHSDNILLDKATGECVHVDFDCIFDKGLHLPKPEVVPFRLTQNMVDAFGPTGADGVYSCNLKAAMSILRDNRATLLAVLEPFVKDPIINWKKHRGQQKKAPEKDSSIDAKQKISIIEERLHGIYNLRNPNHKKIKRTDRLENQEDDASSHPIPLSVEGQVYKMIAEARSSENLCQLYIGWMPWV